MNKHKTFNPMSGFARIEAFAKANQHRRVGALEWYKVIFVALVKPALKSFTGALFRLVLKLAVPAAIGVGVWHWLGSVWVGIGVAVFMLGLLNQKGRLAEHEHDLSENPEWVYMSGDVHHPSYLAGSALFHSKRDE